MFVTIAGTQVSIATDSDSVQRVQQQLQEHQSVLERFGITNLSTLGKLTIPGNVITTCVVTTPSMNLFTHEREFVSAHVPSGNGGTVPVGGRARFHPEPLAEMFAAASGADMKVDRPYWAATWIDIPAGTRVVLGSPQHYLTLICETLTIGEGVVFTWEQPPVPALGKPGARPDPEGVPPEEMELLVGIEGYPGEDGDRGYGASVAQGAPEIEVWTLNMIGRPAFVLDGQHGWQGGEGGDGGRGGKGGKGRKSKAVLVDCQSGPGWGGTGGTGGRGGKGGTGGTGGHGGRLRFYAPLPVIEEYVEGCLVRVSGGAPGPGGMPGSPGAGGEGGDEGEVTFPCQPASRKGDPGDMGDRGEQGDVGQPGASHADAIRIVAITEEEFWKKYNAPEIDSLSPASARYGDEITIHGKRFTREDTVQVASVSVRPEIFSDTRMTFRTPAVPGGPCGVKVQQRDGTLSNPATLTVLPVITGIEPAGRIRPGSRVTLIGEGFAPGCFVRANGQDIPGVTYIDPGRISFTFERPATVPKSPGGERVDLQVILPGNTTSEAFAVELDTFRVLVAGDSAMWGQGLQEHEKYYSVVAHALAAKEGDIGVDLIVHAHSGAPIGVEKTGTADPIPGEVPTDYPTILQQVRMVPESLRDTVDLVLLNGGICDINFRFVLNPATTEDMIIEACLEHCYGSMATLLREVTSNYRNATVVVAGYFPILSMESYTDLVVPLLIAVGLSPSLLAAGIITPTNVIVMSALLAMLPVMAHNCEVFYEESTKRLKEAAEEINAGARPPRVIFANPVFGARNATLAPEAWLYGFNSDLTLQDSLAGERTLVCDLYADRTNVWTCYPASVGHPNPLGAQKYAEAILAAMRDPMGATVRAAVTHGGVPVPGAKVQVYRATGSPGTLAGETDPDGRFDVSWLSEDQYMIAVFPPEGSFLLPHTAGPVTLGRGQVQDFHVPLEPARGLPAGVSLTPCRVGGGGITSVDDRAPLQLQVAGPAGASASYAVTRQGAVLASGLVSENAPGVHHAEVPSLYPATGPARVTVTFAGGGAAAAQTILFDIYIDPCGEVLTPSGAPVADAVVTLYRSDSPVGPFQPLPQGSAFMSPSNRTNPDRTDAGGRFRWDVAAGYYKVRAQREGYLSPSGAPYSETDVFSVPPTATDLTLRLVVPAWSQTGRLAAARLLHTATLLHDGRVLVVGGYNPTAELYDPASGAWSRTGDAPGNYRGAAAVLLPSGQVLVAGAASSEVSAALYDPAAGTWTATGGLARPRYHHTATLLGDGRVLVTGGADRESGGVMLTSAEIYQPATGTWTAASALATARSHHTATLLPSGQVLVTGGQNAGGKLASAELYDPASDAWTTVSAMGAARAKQTATVLATGKVLVTGGGADGALAASAELYDPASRSWSAAANMSRPRRLHAATLLPSGKVLVTGGYDDTTGIHTGAELYDPTRGTWEVLPVMAVGRYQHTATLLADRRLLVTGGFSNEDQASAELFSPLP